MIFLFRKESELLDPNCSLSFCLSENKAMRRLHFLYFLNVREHFQELHSVLILNSLRISFFLTIPVKVQLV